MQFLFMKKKRDVIEPYEVSEALISDIRLFIENKGLNIKSDIDCCYESVPYALSYAPAPEASYPKFSMSINDVKSIEDFISKKSDGFSETLFAFIDLKNMDDVECYKKANVTKQVFSKIKKPDYKPNKKTALAFAVALKLDLDETEKLLSSAGFALSHNSTFDLILEYCILNKLYNIHQVNEILFEFDQELLGTIPRE